MNFPYKLRVLLEQNAVQRYLTLDVLSEADGPHLMWGTEDTLKSFSL